MPGAYVEESKSTGLEKQEARLQVLRHRKTPAEMTRICPLSKTLDNIKPLTC